MVKAKEKGRYYFAMKQTPLKQISVQLKRLLRDARLCVCALVVSCLAVGVSCAFVDRTSANSEMEGQKSVSVNDDPLVSFDAGDSAIAERLGGFSVAQQGGAALFRRRRSGV